MQRPSLGSWRSCGQGHSLRRSGLLCSSNHSYVIGLEAPLIYDHVSGRLSELDREIVRHVPPGGNWRDLPLDFPSERVKQIRIGAANGEGTRSSYYGRLRWDKPAYTVSTYFSRPANGCYIHPDEPRLITIREAARLQSFPDSFRFHGTGRSRFIQIGNAVPPLLAYSLVRGLEPGTSVDLFSGAGGLSLGLDWAGFETVAAVDHDQNANETLARNFSDADPVIDADLSDPGEHQVVMKEIKRRLGRQRLQLLAGGPPCQGFSTAGHNRLDDARNRLVFSFVAAVEDLRPKIVLMENVAALMWKTRRRFLDQIRGQIEAHGYKTSIILAHAEAYGVPQLRRRVILVGQRRGSVEWPAATHEITDPAYRQHQPIADQGALHRVTTVKDAIGDLPATQSSSADQPVRYGSPARSRYQRFARGRLGPDLLGPSPAFVTHDSLSTA